MCGDVPLPDHESRREVSPVEIAVPTCRVCGCTDAEACEGGCMWVADPLLEGDLCSACLPQVLHDAGVRAPVPDAGPAARELADDLTALAVHRVIELVVDEGGEIRAELAA